MGLCRGWGDKSWPVALTAPRPTPRAMWQVSNSLPRTDCKDALRRPPLPSVFTLRGSSRSVLSNSHCSRTMWQGWPSLVVPGWTTAWRSTFISADPYAIGLQPKSLLHDGLVHGSVNVIPAHVSDADDGAV